MTWTLIETGRAEDSIVGTYVIVRDGYVGSGDFNSDFADIDCCCELSWDECDHVIATDRRYYNHAPSIEDARLIVEAMSRD